ncbi:MAG TPA: hypothetical protein VGQ62_19620, partial [Chloroflexota bacterium]|nr:hypothetical protein [Chloroflexota bacterium]
MISKLAMGNWGGAGVLRSARTRRSAMVSLAIGLIGGSALGLAVRIALFVGAVSGLHALSVAAPLVLTCCPWADPVYTRAALRSFGDLQIDGVAVAGAWGSLLHSLLPGLFVDPSRARFALVRVVVHPGSALIGRLIAATIAHAGASTVGVVLVMCGAGWRPRRRSYASRTRRVRPWLLLAGIAVQTQVMLSILSTQPTLRELDATGVSFAANALLPWLWERGLAVSDRVGRTPQ